MSDGSIVISTQVDDAQAQKELDQLNKRIQKLEDKIYSKQQQQLPLVEEAKRLGAELDAAKAKLEEMRGGGEFFTSAQIAEQEQLVSGMQKSWDAVQSQVERYDRGIEQANIELGIAKDRAGALSEQMIYAATDTNVMSKAVARADAVMDKFTKRVKGLAKRVFVFTVIAGALRSLKSYISDAVSSNDEAAAAIARLKGALLTLAQPIMSVVVPALTVLLNVLTRIITVIATIVSKIFGKSLKSSAAAAKAMNAEAEAIEGAGEAAKEAQKNFSGLDEVNTWQSDSGGGGGAGVGGSAANMPDFNLKEIGEDRLNNILGLIKAIGTALLTWKLSKALGLNMKQTLGLAVAIFGALTFVENAFKAITEGVSFENINGMIFGLTLTVMGLYVALGPTAAAIAALVGGLAMLGIAFIDADKNGWNLQNTLLAIAGILATGLGIAALTGSFIPLLIAGIAALLLAITVSTGHGQELIEGLKETLHGFLDFFAGIFTGDTERTAKGIESIFGGLQKAIGAVIDGVRDWLLGLLDWIDEKTNGKLKPLINLLKNMVTSCFENIKNTVSNIVGDIKIIFSGIVNFIAGVFTGDWNRAWKGVKDIFRGMWNGIIDLMNGAINIIIRGLNWLIRQMNKISFDVPSWVPGIGGRTLGVNIPSISENVLPRLATGAVIPPNREFMAVLGDQKQGTNIETPENLLRQIMREELGNKGKGNSYTVNAKANTRVLFQVVIDEAKREQVRTGRNPFDLD